MAFASLTNISIPFNTRPADRVDTADPTIRKIQQNFRNLPVRAGSLASLFSEGNEPDEVNYVNE
ncbi:hypothetical protein MesoLj131c_73910 (plasmid) [Mesorhizobium sp. 131-3-5]|jgi:hypothetical protein|uniref:hypothetical protein n=1 Tax=unclassified Mesorhizobium TaxID=325217 RepID=UPI0018EB4E6F|nr:MULTISPECIES: hypothetical protein [unclassified Mesorhizobium]BCH05643.1 hypothetical protein MesoLj131b_76420 [Mesorhizobium sp. 131-2-5]BCH13133.1 hypothetical protein MesoLj131c_73910 [Mesorhizobium sp. 131-3-5]